ncbi:RUN and FYVE domain-containing protein 4 isoform X1 [Castor canadensis]|uniref:RUN and FYVE domain-containing protein 4 isoform X1 n=1 Tax=Castor canadensis TaxID=51338 RepID=A0AC58MEE9_CASCN
MTEERAILKVTKDLKAAVSAILQGYGDGQGPVTDASAELHRLCGCLELLLQFDQKEQRSFLGPRKDYWDFLYTALQQQRGNTELAHFVCSQNKLKTSLGKGRAFLRFCLAYGQLAESLQLCLLNPELTREWYGPRSPLLCPELQEDILDSLYTLNGVAFHLDLQRPDLDAAWPMFSESRCSNSSRTQGQRPRKTKDSPKEISASLESSRGVQLEETHANPAGCLHDAPREDGLLGLPRSQQPGHVPSVLEKKKEDSRSLSSSQSTWEPEGEELQLDQEEGAPSPGKFLENSIASIQQQRERDKESQEVTGTEAEGRGVLPCAEVWKAIEGAPKREAERGHVKGLLTSHPLGVKEEVTSGNRQGQAVPSILGESRALQGRGTKEGSTTEKPQEQTGVTSVARREDQADMPIQDVVKSLRHGLQQAKEQAQHQEQLLRAREAELEALQEQFNRCLGERAQLQAELEQKQQEAEKRDAMYEEELREQQDLAQAMKTRVLELIREKDRQWQRLQRISGVTPGHCMGCSKVFRRLSRRYPCRLCGGLVCHACSADYKKRERCCPPCAREEKPKSPDQDSKMGP